MRRILTSLLLLSFLVLLAPASQAYHLGFEGITAERPTGTNLVSADGLVLAYDMGTLTHPDQDMKDFSGQGNHGTLTGTTDVAGQFGRAREFSGGVPPTQYIDPGGNLFSGLSEFTIAAWINPSSYTTTFHAVQHNGINSYTVFRLTTAGQLQFQTRNQDGFLTGTTVIPTDEWTHVIARATSAGVKEIYMNGGIEATGSWTSPMPIDETSILAAIGAGRGDLNSQFNGIIDEPLIFSRALSDAEIRALAIPDVHEGGLPVGSFSLMTTLQLHSVTEGTITLNAESDCIGCSYRWDLGDGTVREGPTTTHTYEMKGLYASYTASLLACNAFGTVCESRKVDILLINWPAVILVAGGLFTLTLILGKKRVRYKLMKVV